MATVTKITKARTKRFPREEKEFDQAMIDIARVTRVMAGGKRMGSRSLNTQGLKNLQIINSQRNLGKA